MSGKIEICYEKNKKIILFEKLYCISISGKKHIITNKMLAKIRDNTID